MEPSEWIKFLEVTLWLLGGPIGLLGAILFIAGICTGDGDLVVYGAATFLPPVVILLSYNRCWWVCALAVIVVIAEWVIYAILFKR